MSKRSTRPASRRSLADVPPWIQALTATAGVILTALAVFNLVPESPPAATSVLPPSSLLPPPTAVGGPRVTLERIIAGPSEVDADGTFENVFTQRQSVVLLGQPTNQATDWVPVVADLESLVTRADSGESGRWRASRPGVIGSYQWSAVVVPALSGAGDVLEDLRRNGPASDRVVVATSVVSTE